MGIRIAAFRCLYAIAAAQQGFFTSKQAEDSGFSSPITSCRELGARAPRHLPADLDPTAKHPDLVLWKLWSSNRKGQVEGVYSHQTALAPHEFSDLDPEKLHLTVPTHFRRSRCTASSHNRMGRGWGNRIAFHAKISDLR